MLSSELFELDLTLVLNYILILHGRVAWQDIPLMQLCCLLELHPHNYLQLAAGFLEV